MPTSLKPESTDFRFGLGHSVLEFVATLAARREEPVERLARPDDLARWLDEAGVVAHADCDDALLESARQLREAIFRIIVSARAREQPQSADVDLLNEWASEPSLLPQLTVRLAPSWIAPDPARAAIAGLAAMAIELVTGPDLGRVRNCANARCSVLFIDRSRPGRRRWCSMKRCGNREKTARYRDRRRSVAQHS